MNEILLTIGTSATIPLLITAMVLHEKAAIKKERAKIKERIEKYEKNGTEKKLMDKYLKDIISNEASAITKLKAKEYTNKKEFLNLMEIVKTAESEKAHSIVTPARKKLELGDFEWGVVEYEETMDKIDIEKMERQKQIDLEVKKSLIDVKKKYQGMPIAQIKNSFSR